MQPARGREDLLANAPSSEVFPALCGASFSAKEAEEGVFFCVIETVFIYVAGEPARAKILENEIARVFSEERVQVWNGEPSGKIVAHGGEVIREKFLRWSG